MTYNGWSNYETWATALWLDNDEGSYDCAREMAEDAREEAGDFGSLLVAPIGRTAVGLLADSLRAWLEESMPDLDASLWSDLLGAAFSEVDWHEVAEHYLGES